MPTLIEKLEASLTEIKLVGNRLTELQTTNLKEIYTLIKEIIESDLEEEAIDFLKESLRNHRDLHIVHYYLSMFAYLSGENGDPYLTNLFSYLTKIGKTNLIEYISNQVLQHYDSSYIYNTLATQAERSGNKEELIEILKTLHAKKPGDLAITKKLAKLHEDIDKAQSHDYYETALSQSFDSSDFVEAATIWRQLVSQEPENVDFLISWGKKLAQHLNTENTYELFSSLLKAQENNSENSNNGIIKIIKAALETEVVLHSQFFLIIRAYKELYAEHHYLNDFLILSGLPKLIKSKKTGKSAELLLSHINKFEKIIKLNQGSFVFHKTFGLGMIQRFKKVTGIASVNVAISKLVCDFAKKRNHEMSLEIALKSLVICYEKHIVALKLFKPEDFKTLLNTSTLDFTKEVLLTLEKPATQKEIHDLLVPTVFNEEEWATRWRAMKKLFSTTTEFEYNGKTYALAEEGLDLDSRTLRSLKQTTKPSEKVKIIENYILHQHKIAEPIVQTLIDELKTIASPHPELILFVGSFMTYIAERYKVTLTALSETDFKKHYSQENFIQSYNFAPSQQLRNLLIQKLKSFLPSDTVRQELDNILTAPETLHQDLIFEHIIKLGDAAFLQKVCRRISDHYLDYSEVYVITAQHLIEKSFPQGFDTAGTTFYKMVKLLSEVHRLVSIKKDLVRSKRLHTLTHRILFDHDVLFNYLENPTDDSNTSPEATASLRIFTELEKQSFHSETIKIKIRTLREQNRQRTEK